jgi:hypothetical protein
MYILQNTKYMLILLASLNNKLLNQNHTLKKNLEAHLSLHRSPDVKS